MPVHQESYRRRNRLKFLKLLLLFLPFYQKKYSNWMAILNTLEPTALDDTISFASKWFILTSKGQNLELVNLKCVTYAQSIPLSLKTWKKFQDLSTITQLKHKVRHSLCDWLYEFGNARKTTGFNYYHIQP